MHVHKKRVEVRWDAVGASGIGEGGRAACGKNVCHWGCGGGRDCMLQLTSICVESKGVWAHLWRGEIVDMPIKKKRHAFLTHFVVVPPLALFFAAYHHYPPSFLVFCLQASVSLSCHHLTPMSSQNNLSCLCYVHFKINGLQCPNFFLKTVSLLIHTIFIIYCYIFFVILLSLFFIIHKLFFVYFFFFSVGLLSP